MATNVARTQTEDLADAAAALTAAAREMVNLQAHLERLRTAPFDANAISLQARRSSRIVSALIGQADSFTHAARTGRQLKSVS